MLCVELFAGAGGAALGLETAGFRHGALVEWDADACATMRAAGLRPVIEGDVRDLDTIESTVEQGYGYEPITLLWSSFPCQAWAVAGARKGSQDERNGWPWTVDAIDRFKPKWFLAENVRGLTFHKKVNKKPCPGKKTPGTGDPTRCPGCYLDMVIIPQLKERYAHAGYFILDAADFGVPQHRRRLIVWAGPEPLEAPQPTHGPKTDTPWVSMGEALKLGDFVWDSMRNTAANPKQERPTPSSEPAPTVGGKGNQMVQRVIGGGRNPQSSELEKTRNYRDLTDEPSTTVTAAQIGNAGPWVIERPSPTVSCVEYKGSNDSYRDYTKEGVRPKMNKASDALWLGTGRRRLTVAECAKLQDFPDDHPFQGSTKRSRFQQVGNAVPPKLAEVVGQLIADKES